ncbi:MAG: energy transducer TonB [Spongiibacteraceae bacterium]
MIGRLLACFFVFYTYIAAADFDEASAFYEKHDFSAAFAEFKRLAELGIRDAQYSLGAMYYRGEGVESNAIDAYAWMSLAIEGRNEGIDKFRAAIAKVYSSLDSSQQKTADQRLVQLTELYGSKAIATGLAPTLTGAQESAELRPIKKVIPRYPIEMQFDGGMGMIDIMFGVGKDGLVRDMGVLNCSDRRLVAVTIDALKSWQFEPAVVNGKPVEVYGNTQRFVFQMNGVKFDEKQVLKHLDRYRSLAESGGEKEQYNYALALEVIPSYTKVKVDGRDANRWYFNSASAGNPKAQFSLGKNMLYGQSCSVDAVRSMRWLELAANQNVPDAQYLLAIEMLSGVRLLKNEEVAMRWLQKASDANFTNAQMKLAWVYATHPDKTVRNGKLAKVYIDKVSDEVFDLRTYYEIKAAVAAELGSFEEAVKWQKESRSEMERHDLPLASADAKLEAYKARRAWVEEL